jgi:hypothetical protein
VGIFVVLAVLIPVAQKRGTVVSLIPVGKKLSEIYSNQCVKVFFNRLLLDGLASFFNLPNVVGGEYDNDLQRPCCT